MGYPTVQLTQPIEASLRAGNPWIFYDAVRHGRHEPGDVVDVVDTGGEFLGRGLIEPDSPIRVRLWTLQRIAVDANLLEQRIREALKRRRYPNHETNGFRLTNGEGDRTPGVTVDLYANVAVVRIDGLAAEIWLEPLVEILERLLSVEHVAIRRSDRYRGDNPAAAWFGEEGPDEVVFLENGLSFLCRPIEGQKTGFFLDQRDNRARVAKLAVGRRLLNLFGYSGGFSVAAAAVGAARTVTVDLAQPALDDARRNFELNMLPPAAHGFEKADVFDFLDRFQPGTAPFDVIVCDPPSFAHRAADLPRATAAYERLFARTLQVAHDGAVVALASCSSQLDRARFEQVVANASQHAGVSYVVTGIHGAADDHCWPIGFPEADYLQFCLGTIAPT